MRDHSAQPREDVSIAGVVACGKRSTRGPSRSCVFCVDTWQSVVPVPGVLWRSCVGMSGVGPHRVCGRPGILHHQLQRNTTASSPRLGALAEYVLTHSGSITPRDIRQLQLPHPCRGTLWRPRLGRVRHVTALAVWPGGDGLCGFPPCLRPPGGGRARGRAGWRGGGTEAPRALPARTSDQGDTGNSVDAADARGPVISVPKPSVQACVRSWWCSCVACGGAAPTSVV